MYYTIIGDLVLIPADVPLFKGTDINSPSSMITTVKPEQAIVLGKHKKLSMSQIFWNGEYWWAHNDDIFEGKQ